MLKEIIVSKDEYETRAALLENKVLAELFIERQGERYVLGNIYKGKVNSVLPGMQAAFVDIGLERNAFLHVSDIAHHLEEYEEFIEGEGKSKNKSKSNRKNSNGYRKKSEIPSITKLLEKDQEILVQVDKEPMDTKGPRVTAYITLPGRYLVYMPTVEHVGVSRRIENDSERQRLKDIIDSIRPKNQGFIVRTAAEGKGKSEFKSDMKFLLDHWESINRRAQKAKAPALIHEDLGPIFRVIRDIFTQEVSSFIIDSKSDHDRIIEFLNSFLPSLKSKVKLYDEEEPIFEAYSIEKQIKKALRQKIWLKSGGHIIINPTEALVSIDVNTGKYVGRENAEETILKTNIEAAVEIARQIRLRDLGGIIVIDFIDMDKEEHKTKVLKTMGDALKRDRSRTNILQITDLGLVEMTRQRTKPSINDVLCQPCPYCQGDGLVISTETTSINILREIKDIYRETKEREIKIMASGPVAYRLLGEDNYMVKDLESKFNIRIEVEEDLDLHIEDFMLISLRDNQEILLREE
ncbi:Rne/Rng family ribonuclease [Candidatus Poribacteria bacterium]|nr:Rne/Rng family ribonuclease [Candidatus Poribacteria bacterium]